MHPWFWGDRVLGSALRLPLRLLPRRAVVRIVRGPARGMRWRVGSSVHGCWLGTYEAGKAASFATRLREGGTVFDVGAHVGYYSLCAASIVGPAGTVVAFEPFPRNVAFLREHVAMNGLRAIRVVPAAVSDAPGTVRFCAGGQTQMGRVSDEGELEVPAVSLDSWVEGAGVPDPDVIKIDVEGAEVGALRGARALLVRAHPVLYVATHGAEPHAETCKFLAGLGYSIEQIDGDGNELLCL